MLGIPESCPVKPPLPPEPAPPVPPVEDLTSHAHQLLDSTSGSSLSSAPPSSSISTSTLATSSSTGVESTSTGAESAGAENKENAEGYQLMTRHLVRGMTVFFIDFMSTYYMYVLGIW